jgi:hypothetical protein
MHHPTYIAIYAIAMYYVHIALIAIIERPVKEKILGLAR